MTLHCRQINAGCLHLDCKHTEIPCFLIDVLVRMIEKVRGIHTSDISPDADLLSGSYSVPQHIVISRRRNHAREVIRIDMI